MKKTCSNGHTFHKSSDCPVCPRCEKEQARPPSFLSALGAPARRALEREGITSLSKLATYSQSDLLKLHGFGPGSIPKLVKTLADTGLSFRESSNIDG